MIVSYENLKVEEATSAHLFDVVHILNQATLNQHQMDAVQWKYPWDLAEVMKNMTRNRSYIVKFNEQIVGSFFVKSKKAVDYKAGSLYVNQIAVLPDFQGRGIGSYMIAFAKDMAEKEEKILYVDCPVESTKLVNFYVKNGLKNLGDYQENDYFITVFNFDPTAEDESVAEVISEESDFVMKDYVLNFAQELLAIDSPSGFCMNAVEFVKKTVEDLGYFTTMNAKGNLIIDIPGISDKTVGLSAHIDTLGLMVRSISGDGTLVFTPIGGPILPTYDGEYCRIYTRDKKVYSGTILSNETSVHVHKEAGSKIRDCDNMHIRIDECVKSKDDVVNLGIQNGDFIAIEPKMQILESGFIKSRFLDDKISVACLVGILAHLKERQIAVRHNTKIIISTYEEVGHGSSQIPAEIEELIAVDMGCIGKDLACTEFDVSICAKDSSGPYDYDLTSKLIDLAKEKKLNYVVDIYPMYGSDVSAALRAGNNIRGALIGPGVAASHGMERTHWDALESTISLLLAYLCSE